MKNEILLIPEKSDTERGLVADIWKSNGGYVMQIGKFWERPDTNSKRITILGGSIHPKTKKQILRAATVSCLKIKFI